MAIFNGNKFRCKGDSTISQDPNGNNMYICEVCNKGFQREQNLHVQQHITGHNLPWKLRRHKRA